MRVVCFLWWTTFKHEQPLQPLIICAHAGFQSSWTPEITHSWFREACCVETMNSWCRAIVNPMHLASWNRDSHALHASNDVVHRVVLIPISCNHDLVQSWIPYTDNSSHAFVRPHGCALVVRCAILKCNREIMNPSAKRQSWFRVSCYSEILQSWNHDSHVCHCCHACVLHVVLISWNTELVKSGIPYAPWLWPCYDETWLYDIMPSWNHEIMNTNQTRPCTVFTQWNHEIMKSWNHDFVTYAHISRNEIMKSWNHEIMNTHQTRPCTVFTQWKHEIMKSWNREIMNTNKTRPCAVFTQWNHEIMKSWNRESCFSDIVHSWNHEIASP